MRHPNSGSLPPQSASARAEEPDAADAIPKERLGAFCRRAFLYGMSLATLFLLLLLVQMFVMSKLAHDDRLGAVADKHRRLQTLESPRLILVGGSNLAYGVNSARLAQLTRRNVVNMSVQGSLGARFMLAEVASHLRPGDLIYVALEYEHFFRLPVDGESTLLRLLTVHPEMIQFVGAEQLLKLVPAVPDVLKENFESMAFQVINPLRNRPNLRFQFDEYGDFVGHKSRSTIPALHLAAHQGPAHLQRELLQLLNDFERTASTVGAQVIFGFPAVATSAAPMGMVPQIEEALSGLTVAGRPSDFTYPDSYFYDSGYHLLYDHCDERTDRIAVNMAKALALR